MTLFKSTQPNTTQPLKRINTVTENYEARKAAGEVRLEVDECDCIQIAEPRYDERTGERLPDVRVPVPNLEELIATRDRTQTDLDNLNALIKDVQAIKPA